MKHAQIVKNSDSQTVLLPAGSEFPSHISSVTVLVSGAELVLTPVKSTWDDFFHAASADNESMPERASQHQSERTEF